MNLIYFDNAATSFPKPASVYEEVDRCLRQYCGNPGRSSHPLALAASDKISSMIPSISATAENYPQLGTNQSFLQLMNDVRDCEDKIAYARNRYNMTTARYNMEIVMVPASIVASQMGLQKENLYEISQTQRDDADNMRISKL